MFIEACVFLKNGVKFSNAKNTVYFWYNIHFSIKIRYFAQSTAVHPSSFNLARWASTGLGIYNTVKSRETIWHIWWILLRTTSQYGVFFFFFWLSGKNYINTDGFLTRVKRNRLGLSASFFFFFFFFLYRPPQPRLPGWYPN